MINLYFSTQTSRQFIATILLLFAITEKSLFIRFALLALASAFHITSIPFFIIYVLGQRWRYGWLAVLGLAAVLRFYFANLLARSEEHTSELQSLMPLSYAVFCLKKHIYQLMTEIHIK